MDGVLPAITMPTTATIRLRVMIRHLIVMSHARKVPLDAKSMKTLPHAVAISMVTAHTAVPLLALPEIMMIPHPVTLISDHTMTLMMKDR